MNDYYRIFFKLEDDLYGAEFQDLMSGNDQLWSLIHANTEVFGGSYNMLRQALWEETPWGS